MKRIVMVTAMLLVLAPAAAQERTLGRADMGNVFVWTDRAAQKEAFKLIAAGLVDTNRGLILRLLSCIAQPGDSAVVLDAGLATSTIVVTGGKQSGCRGLVANEDLGQ